MSCLLTVTLHIVDVRLTCLINITYLYYTYLISHIKLHKYPISSFLGIMMTDRHADC